MYEMQSQFGQVEEGYLSEILLKECVRKLVHLNDIMVGMVSLTNKTNVLTKITESLRWKA